MFRARATFWFRLRFAQTRSFCKNPNKTDDNGDKIESNVSSYHDAYKQLDKLDFTTAAKILFTYPPKKKKFGYHLTYFHAQYSNSCIGFHSFFFLGTILVFGEWLLSSLVVLFLLGILSNIFASMCLWFMLYWSLYFESVNVVFTSMVVYLHFRS